jgi:hypothetical protein
VNAPFGVCRRLGADHVQSIRHRDFDAAFVTAHCKALPSGTLKQQLLADGPEPELRVILQSFGRADALTMDRAMCCKNASTSTTLAMLPNLPNGSALKLPLPPECRRPSVMP